MCRINRLLVIEDALESIVHGARLASYCLYFTWLFYRVKVVLRISRYLFITPLFEL